jgi:unsaturated rhamnogalacturonyl hydrolase
MMIAPTIAGGRDIFASGPLAAFRTRLLANDVTRINSGWEDVLIPYGFALAGARFHDGAMTQWAKSWAEHHLKAGFPAGYPTDPKVDGHGIQLAGVDHSGFYLTPYCGEWGGAMLLASLFTSTGDERYRDAARKIADHIIDGSLRGPDGIIVHGEFSRIPWVDTLYYSSAPLAATYAITGDARYAREAIDQALLHAIHLRDETTGCFFHETHFDGRRTPWHWARGNGWVIMALADVLRHCPPGMTGWHDVLSIYRDLVMGLLRTQHSCGLWRIIPESSEAHLETSGSIMIATGMAIGIGAGWLDAITASSPRRVFNEVTSWINDKGALLGCQTPAGAGGWERHKLSLMGERTYGSGTLLRLLAELRTAKLI